MAADIRTVTGSFSTAPQLAPEDMAEAAARGFALVINNRPDGEAPGQPTSAEMAAAAAAAGLDYLYVPVRGGPGPSDVERVREAVAELAAQGVPVITLISDLSNSPRVAYIGLDNRAAGRTAATLIGRFVGPKLSTK